MCVKIAVCLALVACIDCRVIKQQEVPLLPEGMIVEITMKNKADGKVVSSVKIDINEKDKKVLTSMEGPASEVPVDVVATTTELVPSIGNRHSIVVGSCPVGYTRRGGFCFPDDDY